MTYITGPPDWDGLLEGLVVVFLLTFSMVPMAHVLDELAVTNIDGVIFPNSE